MSKIFVVVRVSSEAQEKKEGPEVQREGQEKWIKANPKYKDYELVFPAPYVQSSTEPMFLADRPDLNDVLKMVREGDIVSYWNMERLSRDSFVRSEFIAHLIRKKGIRYLRISDKEYDLQNESDLMILGIYSNVTHKQTSEDMRRKLEGKIRCRDRFEWTGGFVPTGYKAVKVGEHYKYAIDEYWSKIYHRIIEELLKGNSATEVAKGLNGDKIQTRGHFKKKGWGQWWRAEVILGIARNPFYKGKLVNGDWVIPALITEEEWNKVQLAITKNRRRGPTESLTFLLRDLMYCGHCKSKLLGRLTNHKRKTKGNYRQYRFHCAKRYIQGDDKGHVKSCSFPLIDGHKIEEWVWNRTVMYLLNDTELKKAIQQGPKREDTTALQEKIKVLQGEIQRLRRGKTELLDLVVSGYWSKSEVALKAEEAEAEIAKRNTQIIILQDAVNGEQRLTSTLLQLKEISSELKKRVHEYSAQEKRDLMIKVIKEIKVNYIGKDEHSETDRDLFDVDIKYVYDIEKLKEHFRLQVGRPNGSVITHEHSRLTGGLPPSSPR